MANPHQALGRFFDGELPDSEVDAFRKHLATCKECQAGLDELMQLDVLGLRHLQLQAVEEPGVVRLRPVQRAPWWAWASAGLALAATVVLVVSGMPKPPPPDDLWQPGGDHRLTAARSSYPRASPYRPHSLAMGGPKTPPLRLQEVAKLGDDHLAVASALLARGEPGLVENALSELETLQTPEACSERAMAYLVRGEKDRLDYEEALRWAERALQMNPKHGPALWNKALALEGLGLTLSAAKTFDQVVQLGEPGWTSEARTRADQLRKDASQGHDRWYRAREESVKMVEGDSTLSPQTIGFPITRQYFYEAVRSRGSAAEVLALAPIADRLDAVSGGTTLREYVQWASKRNFAVRKPLAETYRRWVLDKYQDQTVIQRLWDSGEDDLAVGALSRARRALTDEEVRRFEQRAQALEDPWQTVLALEKRSEHVEGANLREARQILEKAVQLADDAKITYRGLQARIDLITLLLRASELEAAREEAAKAWTLAEKAGEWPVQRQVIDDLAQLARLRTDYPVGKAYLEESIERSREDHQVTLEQWERENLALLEVENLHFDAARVQMDAAIATGLKLSSAGAWVLADVSRQRPSPLDRPAMDAYRTGLESMSRSERALATEAIGRWTIEVNPDEGRKLLRDAIAQVGTVTDPDGDASRARAFAYSALVMDAAKRRDFAGVLSLFGEEAGAPFPAACALGLALNMERSVVVARGPAGELDGDYDGNRTVPIPETLQGMVSPRLVSVLKGCSEVKVVARPPLFGRPGALPTDIPWSYVLLSRGGPPAPRAVPAAGTHLVVQSVAPAARFQRLGLKTPPPLLSSPYPAGFSVLEGLQATPSHILDALKTASDVDLMTHSLVNPVSREAFLVAGEGPEGDTLTATQIRDAKLQNQPIVMLSACRAAHTAPVLYEPRSLPAAFLIAGARAVFAADEEVPADEGPMFFDAVRARIREGVSPAVALRDVRQTMVSEGKVRSWVQSVLVFE